MIINFLASIIENEVRDGRKDILYHSGIFLFDVFTVFSRAIFNMVMSRKTFPVAEKQRPIPAATSNEPIIIPGE